MSDREHRKRIYLLQSINEVFRTFGAFTQLLFDAEFDDGNSDDQLEYTTEKLIILLRNTERILKDSNVNREFTAEPQMDARAERERDERIGRILIFDRICKRYLELTRILLAMELRNESTYPRFEMCINQVLGHLEDLLASIAREVEN